MREPTIREMLYALIIAYHDKVEETKRIAQLFRTDLWSRFKGILEPCFKVPSFDEVHEELWSFFVKLMMNRFEMVKEVKKMGIETPLALDYSPHPWVDGKPEVLIRVRGAGDWRDALRMTEPDYRYAKKMLGALGCKT